MPYFDFVAAGGIRVSQTLLVFFFFFALRHSLRYFSHIGEINFVSKGMGSISCMYVCTLAYVEYAEKRMRDKDIIRTKAGTDKHASNWLQPIAALTSRDGIL